MDDYTVRFWYKKPDGYWKQISKTYKGYSHQNAEKKWRDEYKHNQIKLIRVSYQ